MPSWIFLSALLGVVLIIASKIRIAGDRERFAVFILGQFVRFKGPGVLIKWSGRAIHWVRIELGDRGMLVSDERFKTHDVVIPAKVKGKTVFDTEYQVNDFGASEVIVSRAVPDHREST